MCSAVPDFAARQRRIYRAQSAAFLANLDLTCSDAELASIDWSALEAVPHWCFLSSDEQHALRLLCGAVFLGPQMHQWIEGRRIQGVRELIGAEAYDLVLCSTDPLADSLNIDQVDGDLSGSLENAGQAVLLGAIQHPAIQTLSAGNASENASPLAASIATPIYQRALEIFLRLRQQNSAPAVSSADEANGTGA